jgi:hypothetical protein
MRGLDPRIHVFRAARSKTWMAGTSPAMTTGRELLFFLLIILLLRSLIRNAADHRGIAELLAQIIHRPFGVGRAALEHV